VNHFVLKIRTLPIGVNLESEGRDKGARMRVLVVEDHSATTQSIELILKSESFNVYTTDLGEEPSSSNPPKRQQVQLRRSCALRHSYDLA
jgi:hypothetical protein